MIALSLSCLDMEQLSFAPVNHESIPKKQAGSNKATDV